MHSVAADLLAVGACPLCGDERRSVFYVHHDREMRCDLWRCTHCSFVYLDPIPSQAFVSALQANDFFYEEADAERLRQRDEQVRRANTSILTEIEHFQRPPGRLLEIGCGRGGLLEVAQQGGWQVDGVELAERSFVEALRRTGGRVVRGDVSEILDRVGVYDVIVMWHVLEHLPCVKETFAKIVACLRPGGLVAVEVPGIDAFASLIRDGRIQELICPVHLSYFDRTHLRSLMSDAGLRMELEFQNPNNQCLTMFARIPW